MLKYNFTIGLFDKDTENQVIESSEAKAIISDILINKYDLFAFTMIDCNGVYKMNSTNTIVFEPSIRVEIATDTNINAEGIIKDLKSLLNQESIMLEIENKDIYIL